MSHGDDICRDAVMQLDGGLACGILDIGSGQILAAFSRPEAGTVFDGEGLADVARFLACPGLKRLGELVRARIGAPLGPSGLFDEVYLVGSHQVFARLLPGGESALVLTSDMTTPTGWGWLRLRSAARLLEPEIA